MILALVAALHVPLYAGSKLATGCAACDQIETCFHLDREANLPTWFSSSLWLFAGTLSALVAASAREGVWHRRGVAAPCVFLSLDEASMFHERFGSRLGGTVSAKEFLFYNWLLYGIGAVAVVGAFFVPFLRSLPRATALRIVLAAGLFVSGAIGAEMLGGRLPYRRHRPDRGQGALGPAAHDRGTPGDAGIIMLIHALLHHLSRRRDAVSVAVR